MITRDEFGPEYVIKIYDLKINLVGFLVVDNTAIGPGKGGIRMTPDVSEEEVFRLARTMTWKNAIAGIPFGGAKAGIIWGGGNDELKEKLMRGFARAVAPFVPKKYIAGPDVNTGEKEMRAFAEEIGIWRAATGKPADFCMTVAGGDSKTCGLPHELGSTGFGVAHAARVAAEVSGIDIKEATVAIEGFGNVGTFAFKHLKEMGAKIIAVSDSKGAVYFEEGLDDAVLQNLKKQKQSVSQYPGGKEIRKEEIFALPVDILIPAAVTDVINDSNKNSIKAKIIVEGANIPMKEEVERELFNRGILIVPDFIANAGGVISSYAEYAGLGAEAMFKMVEEKVVNAAKAVLTEAKASDKNPRDVAMDLARKIVSEKSAAKSNVFEVI